MKIHTWMLEAGAVLAVLVTVALFSDKGAVEWVGVYGVFMSFLHSQVSDRLAEKEAQRYDLGSNIDGLVECYAWERRYFYAKEGGWFFYFMALEAWSALVGVFVFLGYRIWRKFYRRYRPLRT